MLVKAQHLASTAAVRQRAAVDAVVAAASALDEIQRQGAPGWLIGWHRSWILKADEDRRASERDLAAARSKVAEAEGALRLAHRDRRVLERLRDRQATRHARELARHELNDMNELAVTRFAAMAADTSAERDEES